MELLHIKKYCHTKHMDGLSQTLWNYWPYIASSTQILIFFLPLFWHFIWFHLRFITVEMSGLRVYFYCLGRAILEMVYYLSIRSSRLDSSTLKWFSIKLSHLFFQRFPDCSFSPPEKWIGLSLWVLDVNNS